jgi:hypothetical protein
MPRGGKTSTSGQGRPKGRLNKTTQAVKDMIEGALREAGGQAYLAKQAVENPGPFLALVGKILPREMVGPGGGPIQAAIEHIVRPAKSREEWEQAYVGAAAGKPTCSD